MKTMAQVQEAAYENLKSLVRQDCNAEEIAAAALARGVLEELADNYHRALVVQYLGEYRAPGALNEWLDGFYERVAQEVQVLYDQLAEL